jgi:transcriptional regulator with XRE-family HTH domain
MPDATLGPRVAELRRRAGLRQQDIADALDLPRSAIAMLEGDHRHLTLVEAVRLADALDVSLNTLAGRELDADDRFDAYRQGYRDGQAAARAADVEALKGYRVHLEPVSDHRTPTPVLSSEGSR